MIKTTKMILDELRDYSNPYSKIGNLVKKQKIIPITRGLYETNKNTNGECLACVIYGPSYLSFEYALSYYGMIPEAVYWYTSATTGKHKRKNYKNYFGNYSYRDVPQAVFGLGIELLENNGYYYPIASKEKALCDKLYTLSPFANQKELKEFIVESLRIEEEDLKTLSIEDVDILSEKYKSTNVTLFAKLLRRIK